MSCKEDDLVNEDGDGTGTGDDDDGGDDELVSFGDCVVLAGPDGFIVSEFPAEAEDEVSLVFSLPKSLISIPLLVTSLESNPDPAARPILSGYFNPPTIFLSTGFVNILG